MPEMHDFSREERLPSYFMNRLQDFLSAARTDLRLIRVDATHIEVLPAEPYGIAAIDLQGRWRFRDTPVSRAHPGGAAGTYTIWAVATDQKVVEVPKPFTDETDYSFDLRITDGSNPSGTGVEVFEKIGTLGWFGGEITSINQTYNGITGTMMQPGWSVGGDLEWFREPNGAWTPNLRANSVTATELADGSVDTAALIDLAVVTAKVAALAITEGKLAENSVATTKIVALAVTSAKLAAGSVIEEKLGNESVAEAKIKALAVTAAKLAAEAVTNAKIGALAVTEAKIAAEAISTAKIANLAVTAAKIALEAVTTEKIANLAVTAAKIANEAITEAKIANGAVGPNKLSTAAKQLFPQLLSAATRKMSFGEDNCAMPAAVGAQSTAHGLGVTPIAVIAVSGSRDVVIGVEARNSSTFEVKLRDFTGAGHSIMNYFWLAIG